MTDVHARAGREPQWSRPRCLSQCEELPHRKAAWCGMLKSKGGEGALVLGSGSKINYGRLQTCKRDEQISMYLGQSGSQGSHGRIRELKLGMEEA